MAKRTGCSVLACVVITAGCSGMASMIIAEGFDRSGQASVTEAGTVSENTN